MVELVFIESLIMDYVIFPLKIHSKMLLQHHAYNYAAFQTTLAKNVKQ